MRKRILGAVSAAVFITSLGLPQIASARISSERPHLRPQAQIQKVSAERPELRPQPIIVANVSRADLREAVVEVQTRLKHHRPKKLWCVPFAREVSGIEIHGDARTWWRQAGSDYPRGQLPIAGSVLTFRSTGRMPLGHVAVVSKVISQRKILVDQANWVTDRITLDTEVIDVSRNNDWSKVRVMNRYRSFGAVYPTYGFIYRRAGEDA